MYFGNDRFGTGGFGAKERQIKPPPSKKVDLK
jgi:hypothetical protein